MHEKNAAFALYDFESDGADAGIEFFSQIVYIVVTNKLDSRHQGHKGIAVFRLSGGGERSKGAPMKRVFHGQHAPGRLRSIAAAAGRVAAGSLWSAVPRSCSAVSKQRTGPSPPG